MYWSTSFDFPLKALICALQEKKKKKKKKKSTQGSVVNQTQMEPKWEMNWFKLLSHKGAYTSTVERWISWSLFMFFIYLFIYFIFFRLISEVFGKGLWEMYIIAFDVAIQLFKAWFKCTFAQDEIWIRIKDKWLLCRGCVPLKSIRKESGLAVEGVQKHVPCEQNDMGFQCSRKKPILHSHTPEKLTLMLFFSVANNLHVSCEFNVSCTKSTDKLVQLIVMLSLTLTSNCENACRAKDG